MPALSNAARPRLATAAVFLTGLTLAFCMMWVTRAAIGLSPDSRAYLTAARFIAAGKGVKVLDGDGNPGLFTHLAPFLSMLLGALQHFGFNAMKVGRWLNGGCLGLSVLLCGWLAYRAADRSVLAAVLAPLLVFGCVPTVHLFSMLVSEPLFITLMLMTLVGVALAFGTGKRQWLIPAAVAAGGMALTRYAGVAIVPAVALGVLWRWRGSLKERLAVSVGFGVVGMLPVGLWILYGHHKTSRIGNRRLGWHPPGAEQWGQFGQMLTNWTVPAAGTVAIVCGTIVCVGLLAFVVAAEVRRLKHPAVASAALDLRALFWLVAAVYFAFILTSVSLFDAYTPLDDRIFLPLRLCVVLAIASVLFGEAAVWPMRWKYAAAVCGLIAAAQLARIPAWMKIAPARDLGFSSAVWRKSSSVKLAGKLPKTSVLYSNVSDVIDILGGRFCKPIPKTWNDNNGRPIPEIYWRKLPGMWNDMKQHDGYLIYDRKIHRPSFVKEEKLRDDLHLLFVKTVGESAVYQLDPNFAGPPVVPVQYQLPPGAPQ